MAKNESDTKVIVKYTDVPILEDLEFPGLIKDLKKQSWKVYEASLMVKSIRTDIQTAVEAVKADTVVYKDWSSTVVRPQPGRRLDMDRLKTNLMKIGKLDAAQVAAIFEASMVPKAMRVPYLLITAPEGELPKKEKRDAEETE